jgi:hypothetical protein
VILQHIFALLVPSSLSSIEKEAALASSKGMLRQKKTTNTYYYLKKR